MLSFLGLINWHHGCFIFFFRFLTNNKYKQVMGLEAFTSTNQWAWALPSPCNLTLPISLKNIDTNLKISCIFPCLVQLDPQCREYPYEIGVVEPRKIYANTGVSECVWWYVCTNIFLHSSYYFGSLLWGSLPQFYPPPLKITCPASSNAVRLCSHTLD